MRCSDPWSTYKCKRVVYYSSVNNYKFIANSSVASGSNGYVMGTVDWIKFNIIYTDCFDRNSNMVFLRVLILLLMIPQEIHTHTQIVFCLVIQL